jgi:hypothetical protein
MSPNAFGKFGTYFSLVFSQFVKFYKPILKIYKKKQKGKKTIQTISSFCFNVFLYIISYL